MNVYVSENYQPQYHGKKGHSWMCWIPVIYMICTYCFHISLTDIIRFMAIIFVDTLKILL